MFPVEDEGKPEGPRELHQASPHLRLGRCRAPRRRRPCKLGDARQQQQAALAGRNAADCGAHQGRPASADSGELWSRHCGGPLRASAPWRVFGEESRWNGGNGQPGAFLPAIRTRRSKLPPPSLRPPRLARACARTARRRAGAILPTRRVRAAVVPGHDRADHRSLGGGSHPAPGANPPPRFCQSGEGPAERYFSLSPGTGDREKSCTAALSLSGSERRTRCVRGPRRSACPARGSRCQAVRRGVDVVAVEKKLCLRSSRRRKRGRTG